MNYPRLSGAAWASALALLALARPVAGQGLVPAPLLLSGYVQDDRYFPIADATLALVGTSLHTTTDADGVFALPIADSVRRSLPTGALTFSLTYAGHPARTVVLAATPPNPAEHELKVMVQATKQGVQAMPLTPADPRKPNFAWPPPAGSARYTLPPAFLAGARLLSGADARLTAALSRAGYRGRTYFPIPNGFALATPPEQIDAQGKPLRPAARWPASERPGRNFAEFLQQLALASPGRFRVLLFTVTSSPYAATDDRLSREQAMSWFADSLVGLPRAIGRVPCGAAYRCTAVVYEFEKTASQPARLLKASAVSGREHLVQAGILPRKA